MTKRYNDTDLREALHRKYADMPELPSDFMAKMEQRMNSVSSDLPTTKHRPLWRWLSIAACVLLIVGVGLMMMPTEQQQKQPVLANNTINHVDSIHETESEVTIQKDYPRDTEKNIKSHVQAVKIVDEPQTDDPKKDDDTKNKKLIGIIIGSVVGGLILIGIIVFFVVRYYKKKKYSNFDLSGKIENILPTEENLMNKEF